MSSLCLTCAKKSVSAICNRQFIWTLLQQQKMNNKLNGKNIIKPLWSFRQVRSGVNVELQSKTYFLMLSSKIQDGGSYQSLSSSIKVSHGATIETRPQRQESPKVDLETWICSAQSKVAVWQQRHNKESPKVMCCARASDSAFIRQVGASHPSLS